VIVECIDSVYCIVGFMLRWSHCDLDQI